MSAKKEGSASMRMFGSLVRVQRELAEVSMDQLAAHIGFSKSSIIKLERGERMPPPDFLRKAEELIGVSEMLRQAVQHLEREKWPSWFEEYAELEKDAVSLNTYSSLVLHGLLQTEEYARAVFSAFCPMLDTEEVERRVQARLDRQALLSRSPAAQLAFVIEEWVLRRPVGGAEAKKRQLEHLLEVGGQRNIAVQLLPMSYESHAGVDGPMTLLETPERLWLAYLEVQGRSILIDDRNEVSELHMRYSMIRSQALSPGDSAKLIEKIAGEL